MAARSTRLWKAACDRSAVVAMSENEIHCRDVN